jgi:hypothetical protein
MIQDHVLAVESAASRLRSRFAQMVDAPVAARRQALDAELKEALERTIPADRKRLLSDLLKRFPVWGDQAPPEITVDSRDVVKRVEQLEKQQASPAWLAQQLRDLLPTLPADQRAGVEASLAGAMKGALSEDAARAVRERLGLAPDDRIDVDRLAHVFAAVLDCVMAVDGALATAVTAHVGHPLPHLDKDGVKSRAGAAVSGRAVPIMEVVARLDWTKTLTLNCFQLLKDSPGLVFREAVAPRIGPGAVRAAVGQPRLGWGEKIEQKYWEAFEKAYREIETNDSEFRKAGSRAYGAQIEKRHRDIEGFMAKRYSEAGPARK